MLCETRVLFRILKGLDLILFCDLLTSLGYDYLTHTLLIRKFNKDKKDEKKETNYKYKKDHRFRVHVDVDSDDGVHCRPLRGAKPDFKNNENRNSNNNSKHV